MRTCSSCRLEDRPHLDHTEPCSCSAGSSEPTHHGPDCRAIVHEVLVYPRQMDLRELGHDAAGTLVLPPQWSSKGWKLIQNGQRWFRIRILCRSCIVKEEDSAAFKRDYQKACKAARGQDDQTYSQMLAQQSML